MCNLLPLQNIQQPRVTSALKMYGQQPAVGQEEFDSGQGELVPSQDGAQRLSSTGNAGRAPFSFGANKAHSSSSIRVGKPYSPSRSGPDRALSLAVEEFSEDNSARRFVDRGSPAHSTFEYGLGRATGRAEEKSVWQRKDYSDSAHNRFEASTLYNHSNGHENQQPRALIDAYGSDTGKKSFIVKPPQVQRLVVNGIDSKVAPAPWQNTEEEEFDWEDMSPTLADRDKSNDFLSSSVPPFRSTGAKPGFGVQTVSSLEPDNRSNWSSQAQLPAMDDAYVEEAVPSLSVCFLYLFSVQYFVFLDNGLRQYGI